MCDTAAALSGFALVEVVSPVFCVCLGFFFF